MNNTIVVDVWGPFACFTQPHTKVERVSYDVPTPSACRGVLNAIYCKPSEFYYQITKIEVMKPIRHINIKKNEVNTKVNANDIDKTLESIQKINSKKTLKEKDKEELREKLQKLDDYCIYSGEAVTQRNTLYLRNVYYRIHAKIIKQPGCEERVTEEGLVKQFIQRVAKGKCFYQPYLGMRECMCFFKEPDPNMVPIHESRELGMMLYDNFDIRSNIPLNTKTNEGKISRSFYYPVMENGVIRVPDYMSRSVKREI